MRYLIIIPFLFFASAAFSATVTSNAVTGNWTSASSWVGGVVPGANDSVVIVNGAVINLNTNTIIYKMTINTTGTFNLNDDTLTLAGNGILGGHLNIYGTFNGNTGAVYLTGFFYCTGIFNSGTSTFNFNGNDAQGIGGTTVPSFCNLISSNTNNATGKGVSLHQTNTIITGNFIANGVFARNSASYPTSTVTFNGYTQLSGVFSFYLNHVVINAGATLRGGVKTIYLYGNFTCNGSFVCESGTVNAMIDTYSSCQPYDQKISVDNPSVNKFFNLSVNKVSAFIPGIIGSVSPASLGSNTLGHLYVTNNFTVTSGIWDVDGTRQLWVGGNFTINTTATFTASQGRLIMNGTSLTNQMLNTGGDTLYKLTINNTGGGVRLAVNAVVTYDLTLTNGILYTRNGALNNELYLANSDVALSLPAGYSPTSYVKGNLRRAVTADTYVFPVGVSNSIGSYYRPVTLNITATNGTANVIICEDSITNTGYYADWWVKILPGGGTPAGTIQFTYNLTSDFVSGMNECGIMANRGTIIPVNWNFVLTPTGAASGGSLTVNMPTDFSPYAYMLGEPTPVASGTTICDGNTATLTIISSSGYGSFNWYSAQTGGTTLVTGNNSFTTPALSDTTTYWMAHNGQCVGHRWPVTVNVNPIPTSDFVVTQPSCNISSAVLTYTGTGNPTCTFTWNFGSGNASPGVGIGPQLVSFPGTGTYPVSLIVTQNGCISISTIDTVQVPAQIVVTPTVTDATCGSSNGSISLSVSGGWGNYGYYWSGGQTTSSVTSLGTGNYPVTVTDDGGCTFTATYSVSNLGAPAVTANVTQNATCNGSGDGHVTFTATGTGTMNYAWSNGVSGSGNPVSFSVDTLHAGTYNYTVTDVNTCASSGSFEITEPDELVITPVSTDPLCHGQNNGIISVSTTGGTGSYSYYWQQGSSSTNLINMAAGNYFVTVTDDNLCTESITVTLTEPDTLIIDTVTSQISCFGESDGAINTVVTGGTTPITYSWTGGYTTPDIDSLSNGTYNLSILDYNGCAASISVSLTQPYPVDIVMNASNTPCYGTPGGIILTVVTGGTQPYQFIWDNGDTTQNINNLYAGIYWVTVTDDHGCTSVGSTGIQQPDSIVVSITTSSILCYGDNDGSVQTFVSGGLPAYLFLWNNGATTSWLNGISGGNYIVTITDANGCSSVHNTSVYEPQEIVITSVTQNASCFNSSDGEISLTVTGGTPNYNYTWSNGETGSTNTGLASGSYYVTVSDFNSCTGTYVTGIIQPDSIWASASYPLILCWGDTSGYITMTTYGGTAPYTWLWSDSTTTESLNMIVPGLYTCNITDANGCNHTVSYMLGSSLPVIIELVPDYSAGTLLADVNGGTLPYDYAWSNGSTDSLLTQVQSGFYSVTVTDNNGCYSDASLTVFFSFEIPSAFTPNNDGTNDTWEIKGIGAYEEITIEIFNRWGDNLFKYAGSGPGYTDITKQWDGLSNGKKIPAGVYLYIVTIKGLGQTYSGTITLLR